jgi:hypothetical protein
MVPGLTILLPGYEVANDWGSMSPLAQRTMVYFFLRTALIDLKRGKPHGKVVLDLLDSLLQVLGA